jgi:ABC-type glycerol-3-phosphate transport system substrate-binding protein
VKTLVFLIILVLVALPLIARGEYEGWDGQTITIAGGRSYDVALVRQFPDLKFVYTDIDVTTGANITMAALIAAGTPPDICSEFTGRAGQYIVPEYALPLEVDESVWDKAVLDTFKKDGVLYGLPWSIPVQGMAINLDVTDAAGYTVPDGPWTTDDFIEMLEAVQNSGYKGDPTYLYAGSPSADYFWLNWWSAFGVQLFDKGFTRSTVNDTPALVEALTFMKRLIDEGYSPAASATNTVNEVLPGFREGKIAATGFRPTWIPAHLKVAVDQGKISKPFAYTVKPFPVKPGVAWPAPIPGTGQCIFAHKTDNPAKKQVLTEIILYLADLGQQHAYGEILTRYDVELSDEAKALRQADPLTEEILSYTAKGGFMNPGYTYEWYDETRAAALPILRDLYNGVINPAQAAKQYEDAVNAILKEYAE